MKTRLCFVLWWIALRMPSFWWPWKTKIQRYRAAGGDGFPGHTACYIMSKCTVLSCTDRSVCPLLRRTVTVFILLEDSELGRGRNAGWQLWLGEWEELKWDFELRITTFEMRSLSQDKRPLIYELQFFAYSSFRFYLCPTLLFKIGKSNADLRQNRLCAAQHSGL